MAFKNWFTEPIFKNQFSATSRSYQTKSNSKKKKLFINRFGSFYLKNNNLENRKVFWFLKKSFRFIKFRVGFFMVLNRNQN